MPSSSKPLPPDAEERIFACLESPDPRASFERICREMPDEAEAYRAIFASLEQHGLLTPRGSRSGETRGRVRDLPERIGPYRILAKLGHGGMGVVFLGMDEELKRRVAVKLIRPEQLYVPGNKERFQREVEALLELAHPGIVRVLSAGEDEGMPYYAMEFVEGLSLAEVIRSLGDQRPDRLEGKRLTSLLEALEGKPTSSSSGTRLTDELTLLNWPEVCTRLIAEAAEALQHAHEKQVIHRDVKPSNLLVTKSGHLRLVDFGLARVEDGQALTKSTAELGSLPYLAPEYLAGPSDRLDPRQDVYSLGVTLYELLTLHCPYLGQDQEETRRLILAAHPTDPRKLNPKVSWDLATVCLKAMDPDPSHRYQNCADLLADLSNLRARRPIQATRPKPLLRLHRWAERHPRGSAVVFTGALLLLLSGFAYGLLETRSRMAIEELYEQARQLAYVGNIRSAQMDVQTNEVTDGKLRLLRCPEDLRGMEWNVLARRMDQSRRILSKDRTPINDMILSPDGRFLLSCDQLPDLQILSLPSGKPVLQDRLDEECSRLCWLEGTERVALGGLDGIVRIYDIQERKVQRLLAPAVPDPGGISALRHIKAKDWLAVAYRSGWVCLWDLGTDRVVSKRRLHKTSIQSLCTDPSSELLLSSSVDLTARLWSLPDLEPKGSIQHTDWVLGGAFSKKGDKVLTCSNRGELIETRLPGLERNQITSGRFETAVSSFSISSDLRHVTTGGVALFTQDLTRPQVRHKQLGHQAKILALDVDTARGVIYTASLDGTIREWSRQAVEFTSALARARSAIRAVAWIDENRWVAGNSKGLLLRGRLDQPEGTHRQQLRGGAIADILPLTGDDFVVGTVGGSLEWHRFDGSDAERTLDLGSPVAALCRHPAGFLARSKIGEVYVIATAEGAWKSSKLDLGHPAISIACTGKHASLYWSDPEGVLRRSASDAGESSILDLDGLQVTDIHALAGNKWLALESRDQNIYLLDLDTEKVSGVLEGHTREPDSVQYIPAAQRIVSTGGYEKKIILWEPHLEERLLDISLPFPTFDMAVDPSGQKILLGLMWGFVALCDTSPPARPLELTHTATGVPDPSKHGQNR